MAACTLVLCGKSVPENEFAQSLKNSNTLKLPENDDVSLLLHSESDKPFIDASFGIDAYMGSLSTTRFGRFLLWSPRLTSTHDVVAQYVSLRLLNHSLMHLFTLDVYSFLESECAFSYTQKLW